jgi:hypothetical protein
MEWRQAVKAAPFLAAIEQEAMEARPEEMRRALSLIDRPRYSTLQFARTPSVVHS